MTDPTTPQLSDLIGKAVSPDGVRTLVITEIKAAENAASVIINGSIVVALNKVSQWLKEFAPAPTASPAAELKDIGWAVRKLKEGQLVTRKGWNGKGMFLALKRVDEALRGVGLTLPFIVMKTVGSDYVPWLASHTDQLAEDWEVVA